MTDAVCLDKLLAALRAAGEPTRLRLLALLGRGELNVKDLTRILGQSQPRISRHLKRLCDAGLIERFREGSWVYFRLCSTPPAGPLTRQFLDALDKNDPVLVRDRERAENVKAERALKAQDYFRAHAAQWDEIRSLHIAEDQVERAMTAALTGALSAGPTPGPGAKPIDRLLDVGTGTGRILELFADHYCNGLGIDINTDMLAYARAKLEAARITHAQVRQGDLYNLPVDTGSQNAVIIHQVLHFLESPALALAEGARVLAPGGRLLVVDFAAHDLEHLREELAHRRLGFTAEQIRLWSFEAGLEMVHHQSLMPDENSAQAPLTVCLWLARKPAMATAETSPPQSSDLESAA